MAVRLALVLLVLMWGSAYPVVKNLLFHLSPMQVMLARFWISSLPILIIAWRLRAEVRDLVRRHPWRLLALSLFGVPGYHLNFNMGTRLLSADPVTASSAATLASVLVATVPAWTALFARLLGQERLRPRQWLGQALAFAGVLLIVSGGKLGLFRPTLGAVWVLGAPVSWALYSVIARPLLSAARSSLPLTSIVVLLGTLLMSLFTPAGTLDQLGDLSGALWAQLFFVALLSTCSGYLVWAWVLQRMETTRASAAIYFVPVTSALVSILFFAEKIGPLVLLGGGAILGGVLLIQETGRRAMASGGLPSGPAAR